MSQGGKIHRCIASLSPEVKAGAVLNCPGLCWIVFCVKVLTRGHKADTTALLLRLPDQKQHGVILLRMGPKYRRIKRLALRAACVCVEGRRNACG